VIKDARELRLIYLVLKHFIKISDKLSVPDFRETSAKEMPYCAAIKGHRATTGRAAVASGY
jgi:hypothetical protein